MTKTKADLCACYTSVIDKRGIVRSEVDRGVFDNLGDKIKFLKGILLNPDTFMIQPNSWLIKRDAIIKVGLWNENLTLDDDGEFFFRLFFYVGSIELVKETLNYYRKHGSDNLASRKSERDLISGYDSILCKTDLIADYCTVDELRLILSGQLCAYVVRVDHKHKELFKRIYSKIDFTLDFQRPVLGGHLIELLKYVFGFKFALFLHFKYRSFFYK